MHGCVILMLRIVNMFVFVLDVSYYIVILSAIINITSAYKIYVEYLNHKALHLNAS